MITENLNFITEVNKGAAHVVLGSPLATMDNLAHVFTVQVTDGGSAADLSGAACTAYFIRADGVTVVIDGTVSGSTASVTLGANCYAVPGRFTMAVKLTQGSTVRTILRTEGSVTTSRTDAMTGTGSGVQSFDQLVEAVEDVGDDLSRRDRVVNLLDNSWFGNPIAQAGQNGMHGSNKYVCDRWISWNADATFANGCITPGSPIDQRISLNMVSIDKTYTVAFCLSDGTIKASYGTLQNGAGSFNFGMHAIAEASYVRVRLMTVFEIRWAALYEGAYTAETLPAYQYKGYAAELAECMRYYQQSFAGNSVTNGLSVGALIQIGTTPNCLQTVEYRVPMRIIPTVTIYSPVGTKNAVWNWQTDTDVGTNVEATYTSVYGFIPAQAQTFEKGIPYAFHYTASADL